MNPHMRLLQKISLLLALVMQASCSDPESKSAAASDTDACCPPEGAAGTTAADAAAPAAFCGEHRVPEAECGICGPDRLRELPPGRGLLVRLPAPASTNQVTFVSVEEALTAEAVECPAELVLDSNRLAMVVAPVAGILREVHVDLGARVASGQPLAALGSPALAEAVTRLASSWQTLQREQRLRARQITPEKDFQQAEAEHRLAREQLRALGFTEQEIEGWLEPGRRDPSLVVRAPLDAEVIERNAIRGAWVEAGQRLFTLADRSTLRARLSLPESALSTLRIGLAVELWLDALPSRVVTGRVAWIAAEVDARTRRLLVLAEVPNPDGLLRAHMFGRARLWIGPPRATLWIPADAVHRTQGPPVVFVPREPDLFEARVVRLGRVGGQRVEVCEGLQPGESVAATGGFTLKSQLFLSRLGAGCAED
ncbi:efflux RND transporter periplasmic adaptor subunit [Limisphaera sp. VF-2]|uniref:efflux RND transporter periplasmic adaptor subunit n=1 Tax=Limisphaera sp. VF-2 TaxID=3400418 RepID=UPI0030A1FEB6